MAFNHAAALGYTLYALQLIDSGKYDKTGAPVRLSEEQEAAIMDAMRCAFDEKTEEEARAIYCSE